MCCSQGERCLLVVAGSGTARRCPGVVINRLRIYEYLHEIGVEKLETFVYHARDHNPPHRTCRMLARDKLIEPNVPRDR
ncbi:MAG: hypothetical protein EF813_07580 [Methanosarcinales archaeon]|nr:MAG: hypothetical protein EF813_07580 [Methanosarcinales archaeon]